MMSPSRMRMTLGGRICPRVPEAQMVPAVSSLLYPRRSMVGSETSPMVMTLAPTMPVEAARMAPTTTTEIAMPPRCLPNSRAMVSSNSSASPDFSSATPMKTKSGTARSVKFVMVPQIRRGRISKKFAFRSPRPMPLRPKKSPVKVRLKATGKPKKRKAIIPANIRAARICSRGSMLVHLVDADFALFPAHGPEEILDGLGDGLQGEEREADDDHRLEEESQGDTTRVRRALEDAVRVPHEGPRGEHDHDRRGVEEHEVQDEIGPGLPARGPSRVDDVHPHMLVPEHGVAGGQQVHHAEEMPLQLLQPHGAGAEGVTHDHVEEDHQDHEQHEPRDGPAEAFLEEVDPASQLSEGECQGGLLRVRGLGATAGLLHGSGGAVKRLDRKP